jgi:hypothetical protein
MSKKMITCKRCGTSGLVWATTKAGKYYLTPAESAQVKGENGRVIKTLQLAHRCPTPEEQAIQAGLEDALQRVKDIEAEIHELDCQRPADGVTAEERDAFYDDIDARVKALRAERKEVVDKYKI